MRLITFDQSGGVGRPLVFVHGFACAGSDWSAQVRDFSASHRTIAVDLRAHGKTPGEPDDCSIERFGADVASVLAGLGLEGSVLVGHSMGCRVVVEAALQAPDRVSGLILIDGSQFDAAYRPNFQASLDAGRYPDIVSGMFGQMFNARSDAAVVAAIVDRTLRLSAECGARLLRDMARYDSTRLAGSLRLLQVPVMALQTTTMNVRRERRSLELGEQTPYLEVLRETIADITIEILFGLGHFPQIDAPIETNTAIARFLTTLRSP